VRITIGLLEKAMRSKGWEKSRFLIDGFPRNPDNVQGWNEVIGDKADTKGIIYIKCSEDTMAKRILKRAETSGRIDDNIETIKKRFTQYTNETWPIIEAKKKEDPKAVFELNGEEAPEKVYQDCITLIGPLL